ncbi:hypothetical protein D9619_009666 [Psilocybe cf. subviscida]|uniref:Uncharacterized protein n=1 Tax=Psilocybe cf. subviscida TaxID=2480587 RepID=A0A8H5BKY9_9AGAR|nr:hypothetical protein D9619_009666 [Psilocybe cf. subviscida]
MTTKGLSGNLTPLILPPVNPPEPIMSRPTPIIAFGPSPEIYFVGVGMSYYTVGMPDTITSRARKWPAALMRWMSIDADGAWMVQHKYNDEIAFDSLISPSILDRMSTSGASKYVTFGPTKGICLAVGRDNSGQWFGDMEDEQIRLVEEMLTQLGDGFNFGMELRGILFGKGSTMIYMFRGGFAYHTDSEAEGSELEDDLNLYANRSPPWTVERGSSLCH